MSQTRLDESGGRTVAVEEISVQEVCAGDVLPSHDGHEHIVTYAGRVGPDWLICVERSDGSRYATDFDPSVVVAVVV